VSFRESASSLCVCLDYPRVYVYAGVDETLARHVAHLFVRDPLVIFKEKVELDDSTHMDHFENVQSTNWRSVRWKPPPPDSPDMG
jgi:glutamate--cysteine ligase catalytic subunit